ncbi:MAG: cell wall hydrolase [Candidatus Binatia bacterium]
MPNDNGIHTRGKVGVLTMALNNMKFLLKAPSTRLAIILVILCLLPASVAPGERPVGLLADLGTISSLPPYWEGPDPLPRNLTEEGLAALTVYMEAKGESFAGKLAVAAVIRNRMKMKYQSDGTVKGTVLKRSQFQPWNTRQPHQVPFDLNKQRLRDSLLAWRLVQDGRDVVGGAVLFYNPRIVRTPYWARVSHKVATIGQHEFFVPRQRQT